MPTCHVLDLSHHNDVRSFDEIAASGVIGVILKASQGTSFEDPTYQQRSYEALKAGLKVASYHYLEGGDIAEQMRWFLEVVQPVEGERLVIDHEADASLEELVQAVNILASDPHDVEITVYSGHLIKEQLGDDYDETLAGLTSLWIAQYGCAMPSWPSKTWPTVALWQWSDSESCPGVNGPVDANHFNGTADACARWIGPVPQPQLIPIVEIAIAAPPDVAISININGVAYAPT